MRPQCLQQCDDERDAKKQSRERALAAEFGNNNFTAKHIGVGRDGGYPFDHEHESKDVSLQNESNDEVVWGYNHNMLLVENEKNLNRLAALPGLS